MNTTGAQVLAVGTIVLSVFSIVADFYVIALTLRRKSTRGNSVRATLAQTRLAIAGVDLVGKMGYIGGTLSSSVESGASLVCTVAGAATHFADLSIVMWTLCVTFVIVKMITDKSPVISIKPSLTTKFHALCWGVPLLLALLPLSGLATYGKASLPWCTIIPEPVMAPVAFFYLPVLICHFCIIAFFVVSHWSLLQQGQQRNAARLRSVARRIKVYPDAFHVIWTACYLQAVQDVTYPFRFIFLNAASQVALRPSMGVINLIINWRVLHPRPSALHVTPATNANTTTFGGAAQVTRLNTWQERTSANGNNTSDGHAADMSSQHTTPRASRQNSSTITPSKAAVWGAASSSTGAHMPLPRVMLLTAFVFALGCLLLSGAAIAVTGTVRNADIALSETRQSVSRGVADVTAVQLDAFLAYPRQVHTSLMAAAGAGSLPPATLEGFLNTTALVRPLEELLYPLWIADARFLALYTVTPNNQALKFHNLADGRHICTQLRHYTPQWYAEKRTVRTERCRTRQRPFWDSSQWLDSSTGQLIPPSFVTTRKTYNPFGKTWYGLGNATEAGAMSWRGGIFDHNLDYPVPVVEAVFHVDWPSVQPSNCVYGWPGGRRTVFKLELHSTELGSALRKVHTGAHGQVVIVDDAGTLMAARNNSAHLFTVNSSHPEGVFFGLQDLAREFPEQFAPFASVTAEHLRAGSEQEIVPVPLPPHRFPGRHVLVIRLPAVSTWRVVLLLDDRDFLTRTQELQSNTVTLTNITAAAIVSVMWALYFRVTKT